MPPGHGFCVRGTQNLFTSDEAIQRASEAVWIASLRSQ